ncbi:MAG TPA: hypothetical protein VFH85_02175, partial [Gammaproteobacteria bacterium]|nr:hypothetical protein [Gammaproteobacteria bacterium]
MASLSRWQPFPIVGGAYSDDAKPWTVQDTVNFIPVAAEKRGTRSPTMLRCAPGMTAFTDLGSNAPIRGMRNVEGKLFVVSGSKLYRVGVDGAVTELGTIPGVERVSMAHNQITGGNQLAIADGLGGGHVYDTADETLTRITDEAFHGASSFDFIDGY